MKKMDFQSKSLHFVVRLFRQHTKEEEEEEEEWISSRTRCNKKSGKASTP